MDDKYVRRRFLQSSVLKYRYADQAYVMPFSAFYHPSEMLEIQLAVSRDGIDWDRLGDRQPWIRIPLDEDRVKRMYASPAVVRQGNLLYHYYSAIPQYNGGSAPGDYKIEIMPD